MSEFLETQVDLSWGDVIDVWNRISTSWLPPSLQQFVLENSITRFWSIEATPKFDIGKFSEAIRSTHKRVVQIVFIYSDSGDHVLSKYVYTGRYSNTHSLTPSDDPAFFWVMTHDSVSPESISLAFLVTQDIHRWVPRPQALARMLSHYSSTTSALMDAWLTQNRARPTFAWVGIIPWLIMRAHDKNTLWIQVPYEIYEDCKAKNLASAGFVSEAVNRTYIESWFSRETDRVIVLGYLWKLWEIVFERLDSEYWLPVSGVDIKDSLWSHRKESWKVLVVDCTQAGSLEKYFHILKPGDVWLNEAYWTISSDRVTQLEQQNIVIRHIQWVEGESVPPLVGNYQTGIPCCAARIGQSVKSVRTIIL